MSLSVWICPICERQIEPPKLCWDHGPAVRPIRVEVVRRDLADELATALGIYCDLARRGPDDDVEPEALRSYRKAIA